MESKKRISLIIVVITLFLCFNLFINRQSDKLYINVYGSDFQMNNVEDYELGGNEDQTALFLKEISGDEALIYFDKSQIRPGEYNVEFQYSATNDGTTLRVSSPNYVNGDNTFGKDFVNIEIDENDSVLNTEFTVEQDVDDLSFYIQTTDENFAIGRITLTSSYIVQTDNILFIAILLILAIIILYIINSKKDFMKPVNFLNQEISSKRVTLAFIFIMISASIVAVIPLIGQGLNLAHDAEFHLARIEGIVRGLESGQFPVKIHGGILNDYGYPNGIFYPDLFLYFPAILVLLNVNILTAYKVFIFFINILAFVISYFSFKKLLNSRNMGVLLAIFYILSPYRLANLYTRGAVGEFLAMTFLPLVLYGLYAVIFKNKKDWPYLVIGATGILQSHILSTAMVAVFAVFVAIIGFKNIFFKEKRIKELLLATGSVLILNLWFIVPFLLMMNQLGLNVMDRTTYLSNRLISQGFIFFSSLYQGSDIILAESITYSSVGWVFIIAMAMYVIYRIIFKTNIKDKEIINLGDYLLLLAMMSLLLTTGYFAWDVIQSVDFIASIIGSIQFASRLSVFYTVALTGLIGVAVLLWFRKREIRAAVSVLLTLVIVIQTSIWFDGYLLKEDSVLFENKYETFLYMDVGKSISLGEYVTSGSNPIENIQTPQIISTNESVEFSNLEKHGTTMSFNYTADLSNEKTTLILPYTYIPNYVITVDGKETTTIKYDGAKVAFDLEKESGFVEVKYQSPLTFRIFEFISLAFLILAIFYKYYIKNKIVNIKILNKNKDN